MRTLREIDSDIADVKEELADVRGCETEVYARIVGYYRSVRNWNRGKRAEFGQRKMFECVQPSSFENAAKVEPPVVEAKNSGSDLNIAYYEFFSRKTCPNCPPVREYMKSIDVAGSSIDVDSEDGFARASDIGVLSAPTVVFFDANGVEVARASSVATLQSIFAAAEMKAAS